MWPVNATAPDAALHNSSAAEDALLRSATRLLDTGSSAYVTVEHPVDGHPNFNFPVFYTMWHMVASVLGASVIMKLRPPDTGFPTFKLFWEYKWQLIPIAICTATNIGCNNVSLSLVSLFLNQVIKATGPLPTMLFSVMLEGKRYGWGMILSCGAIVAGTILAVPSGGKGPQTSAEGGHHRRHLDDRGDAEAGTLVARDEGVGRPAEAAADSGALLRHGPILLVHAHLLARVQRA